jgi:glycosyltransferase involved in cell wall biosynthesis
MSDHLVLVSDATKTCGVEEFARQTARHMGKGATTAVLSADMPAMNRAIAATHDVVLNLPVVAWKKRIVSPILAAAHARMAKREVTIVLHEWADLALARRLSYLPLLPMATRVMFSSPEVMAQFAATPLSAAVTRRRGVLPIPPNFAVPAWTRPSARSEALRDARARGTFVLAQFGSIYPKKDPLALLEAAAELRRRGTDLRVVFIGSFIGDRVEAEFAGHVARLGLADVVDVTGYVGSAEELYGLFEEVDAFLYPLSEGLTSRRGSVLAAALSGRPVVVTTPERADSLDHHPLFKALLGNGTIHLAPRDADASALADAVLATRGVRTQPLDTGREVDAVWEAVKAALAA